MNTENTSTEVVTVIKVEKQSDDEVESDLDLYADHEIKEEMVIGPVVLQRVINATNYCEDVPAPKKPRLEVKDEKTEQVEPHQKEIIEDNTVEIVSNVIKKKRKKVGNNEQTKCYNPTPGISDDEAESDLDLYADHEIKEEMVIGPVVLQRVVNATNYCGDVPAPKKPRLEVKNEKTEQVEPHQKEIIEDNTVEVVSNEIKKKRNEVGNNEQTKCYALRTYNPTHVVPAPKKTRLERNEKKTYQVESQKEMKKNNTQEIKSSVEIKKKLKKVKNQEHTKSYNLRKHNQTTGISQNVFICNDCSKKYRKKCELAQHIVSHEKIKQDNNYKCKECTYQTGSQDSLEQHYKLHDIDRSFICDLCGYRSDKKYKLLKHLKSKHSILNDESKEKTSVCSVCGYRCKHNSALLIHLRRHTGEKPYSCSECDFKFKSKSNLTAHLRIHTKSYSCSECEFKCRSKPKLKRHLCIHTKPYSCSECEYKGTSKSNLTAHLRIHRKPYSCSECKYKCSTKKDLTRHFLTHSGEKPYSCSECEFKCAYKSSLRTHLRTHIGEKPYSCSTCKHKFAKKGNLITHLRTHTGEKAYSCSKCEFKCKSRLGLISHFYIHTGKKPYSCSECDYKCVTKSRLTTHLRIHNGEICLKCAPVSLESSLE